MKRIFLMMIVLAFAAVPVMAQDFGSVSGVVYDGDNGPVSEANVHLSGDPCYYTQTSEDGAFTFDEVAAGAYTAIASKMGLGHDAEEIEVVADQNTVVDFVLEMGCGGDGGHHGGGHGHGQHDSLIVVELSGSAIVEEDEYYTHYFLDVNGDDIADYRLGFGPYWYDPGNGATRPEDGDEIDIVGGLMGYSDPQMVVVYEIDGLFWRAPGDAHGGYGGHGEGGCNPDSLDLIETSGFAIVIEMQNMDMYFLDEDNDEAIDYRLNFGAPWYDPGNGATRPEDGDSIYVVGGLMDGCQDYPVIIVYEINGLFWRDPGDTTSLWLSPTSVDETNASLIPSEYVVAHSYPNPFNPSATISFTLAEPGQVKLTVYDLLGKEVAVLADAAYSAGEHQVVFDVSRVANVSSTIYFYRVETAAGNATGKMLLLK